MAKGYWIARVDVADPEQYQRYVAASTAAWAKYGAVALALRRRSEVVSWPGPQPQRDLGVPSFEALACYHSEEYQSARRHRRASPRATSSWWRESSDHFRPFPPRELSRPPGQLFLLTRGPTFPTCQLTFSVLPANSSVLPVNSSVIPAKAGISREFVMVRKSSDHPRLGRLDLRTRPRLAQPAGRPGARRRRRVAVDAADRIALFNRGPVPVVVALTRPETCCTPGAPATPSTRTGPPSGRTARCT